MLLFIELLPIKNYSGLNELLSGHYIKYAVNVHNIWDFARDVYYYVVGRGTVSKESTAFVFKVDPQDGEKHVIPKR
jgi:chitinase